MKGKTSGFKLFTAAVCAALVGCSTPIASQHGGTLKGSDPLAFRLFGGGASHLDAVKRTADFPVRDWTTNAVVNRDLTLARALKNKGKGFPSDAEVKKAGSFFVDSSANERAAYKVAGFNVTSPVVSGAPGFYGNTCYWLAEDGQVFTYVAGSTSAPTSAFTIKNAANTAATTDHFRKCNTTIIFDFSGHSYLLACSVESNFYAVELSGTSHDTVAFEQMTGPGGNYGASTDVNFTPAPFADWTAAYYTGYSTVNVYAVSNKGALYKFPFNIGTNTFGASSVFVLPQSTTSTYADYYRASPIVVNNTLSIGSWQRRMPLGQASLAKGVFYCYDVSGFDSNVTPKVDPTQTWSRAFTAPFYTFSTLEFNSLDQATLAFVPVGNKVGMFNLQSSAPSNYALTPELGIDPLDNDEDTLGNTLGFNSGQSTANAMLNAQPVIDNVSYPAKCYIEHCNSLFSIDYSSGTYDPIYDNWNTNAFAERAANWIDPDKIMYGKTYYGRYGTDGTLDPLGFYVSNISYPTLLDNYPYSPTDAVCTDAMGNPNNSLGCSLNHFTISKTTPPHLNNDYFVMTDNTHATDLASGFVSYGGSTFTYTFATFPNTTSSSSGYIWTR